VGLFVLCVGLGLIGVDLDMGYFCVAVWGGTCCVLCGLIGGVVVVWFDCVLVVWFDCVLVLGGVLCMLAVCGWCGGCGGVFGGCSACLIVCLLLLFATCVGVWWGWVVLFESCVLFVCLL